MNITLINPRIGRNNKNKMKLLFAPLTISTIAGATPKDVKINFYDERIEKIDFSKETDLVAITVETYTAKRAYEIAKEYRGRGIPVVLGGFHPTLVPKEALKFADSIVINQADNIWSKVIEDAIKGKLKKFYEFKGKQDFAIPNNSVFKNKKYLPIEMIESSRGCPYSCDFCSITNFFKRKLIFKQEEYFINEIKNSKYKNFYIVDDNLTCNKIRIKNLCKRIIPLKIKWSCSASISIAEDKELLDLMSKSGCIAILIGFESLEERNLKIMNKNAKASEYIEAIKKIKSYGIQIHGSFVFGYDYDTKSSIREALKFAIKNKFSLAYFYPITPFPGTPLYKRLKSEGKLLNEKWWLDGNYRVGESIIIPKNITPKELTKECDIARKKFYSIKSVIYRSLDFKTNSKNLIIYIYYFFSNIKTAYENKILRKTYLGFNNER